MKWCKWVLFCGGLSCISVEAQEGYVLQAERVLIEGQEQWDAWQGPAGVHVITPGGTVWPRFLRADINAVVDAASFSRVIAEGDTLVGGISESGSNPELADRIIDGDLSTSWAPDPEDGIENWYIEIDLGRATVVREIAVRFATDGDPFLKFRVMVSDGRNTYGSERRRQFFRVGQVIHRNKDQREFTFPIAPVRPVPAGVEGEMVQFVRIDALASDGPRGARVSPDEYTRLTAGDKGAIDYFRVTTTGREIPVLPETYAVLSDAERGPVRHYRRERPRLAEVEVHALGDNIVALTQRPLFEDQRLATNFIRRQLTDGLRSSSADLKVYDPFKNKNQLAIDLGARYWIDRVRLVSPQDPPMAYQLRLSDGSLDPSGNLVWTAFDERLNPYSFSQLEESFPKREVRHIELRRLDLVGSSAERVSLSEVQAYGEGYVSNVELTSPLIKLGKTRIFSTVEWDGQAPLGTDLELYTRSGDDLLIVTRYYDRFGREISEDRWVNMRNVDHRGPVVVEEFPGPRWSNWSEFYSESGEVFKSPSPRRMVQIKVGLRSHDPMRAAQVSRIKLNFTPPLVDQALAEIWPVRGLELGREHQFTLYWQPRFARTDPGFDKITLRSSAAAPMDLISVQSGSDFSIRSGRGTALWPGDLTLNHVEPGGLELAFPAVVREGDPVYAIRFRTKIFRNSTIFSLGLTNSQRPGVEQSVSEGDVGSSAPSQSMVVVAALDQEQLFIDPEISSRICTPNGDGINDETVLRFSVLQVDGPGVFNVGVYDLRGHRVRDLSFASQHSSGEHHVVWNGRDGGGRRVPPGVYLLRVEYATDAGTGTPFTAVVSVVY